MEANRIIKTVKSTVPMKISSSYKIKINQTKYLGCSKVEVTKTSGELLEISKAKVESRTDKQALEIAGKLEQQQHVPRVMGR